MNLNEFHVTDPVTYTITFDDGATPKLFQVYDEGGDLYYFRYLDGKTGTININFPHSGIFRGDNDNQFTIISSKPLVPDGQNIQLPKPDRNFDMSKIKIEMNPKLTGTPARIFPTIGIMEWGPKMMGYTKAIRVFISLHEAGHMLYSKEMDADLWALKSFLGLGYNASTAFYALSDVLHLNPENIKRIRKMFEHVMNFTR